MNILLYCVTIAWTLATGPADYYSVYRDSVEQEIQSVLPTPPTEVCLSDGDPHRFAVRAFSADGTPGPLSDWSEPVVRILPATLRVVPVDLARRADLDDNGVVGWSDFTIFSGQWGKGVPIR